MSLIKTIGIDLAKLVSSIHGVDEYGKTKLKQTVKRNKLLEKIADIPPCIIGMEACSGIIGQGNLQSTATIFVSWHLNLLSSIVKEKRTMPMTLKQYVKQ